MALPSKVDLTSTRGGDGGVPDAAPPPFTDIAGTGWVNRAPLALRPYLLLARLDRPIGAWLLFLPGAWGILLAGAPLWPSCRLLALFGVGSVVMRSAGCVINDMWDRDLDAQVSRTATRPLASGVIGLRQAAVFLLLLLLAGLAVLVQLRPLCWALGASSLLLVGLYPLAKRITWWPQLVMGVTFGFGAPMGYAAAAGPSPAAGAALYAAAIAWDLGFDTIYGFLDMRDDERVGIKSTSRRFAHAPRAFLGACYAACVLLLGVAAVLGGLSVWVWPALLAPAALLAWQVARLDTEDAPRCLALFRLNRQTGLAVAAALLIGRM